MAGQELGTTVIVYATAAPTQAVLAPAALTPAAPLGVMLKLDVPTAEATPEITPVEVFSVRPAGNVPVSVYIRPAPFALLGLGTPPTVPTLACV